MRGEAKDDEHRDPDHHTTAHQEKKELQFHFLSSWSCATKEHPQHHPHHPDQKEKMHRSQHQQCDDVRAKRVRRFRFPHRTLCGKRKRKGRGEALAETKERKPLRAEKQHAALFFFFVIVLLLLLTHPVVGVALIALGEPQKKGFRRGERRQRRSRRGG